MENIKSHFKIKDSSFTQHPKNLGFYVSNCCSSDYLSVPISVFEALNKINPDCICKECKQSCKRIFKHAYKEVSKGTWRLIE